MLVKATARKVTVHHLAFEKTIDTILLGLHEEVPMLDRFTQAGHVKTPNEVDPPLALRAALMMLQETDADWDRRESLARLNPCSYLLEQDWVDQLQTFDQVCDRKRTRATHKSLVLMR